MFPSSTDPGHRAVRCYGRDGRCCSHCSWSQPRQRLVLQEERPLAVLWSTQVPPQPHSHIHTHTLYNMTVDTNRIQGQRAHTHTPHTHSHTLNYHSLLFCSADTCEGDFAAARFIDLRASDNRCQDTQQHTTPPQQHTTQHGT